MAAIKPITTYKGKIVPLFNDNIDTDQIIPKVHLKRISKSGFGPFAFDEWRYLPDGSDNPIVLEKSAREHLAQYVEIEVDLPNQTVSSPDKRFHFEIDETWKNKLVNGLDDIAITLQYESLIEKYEKSL